MSVFQSRWHDWARDTPESCTAKTDKRASVSNVSAYLGPFSENRNSDIETEKSYKTPAALTDKTDKSLSQGFSLTADKADENCLVTLLRVPEGCPEAWCDGIARLLVMPAPSSYGADAWAILKDDAAGFFWRWAGEAARLGWDTLAVWGVHPTKPQARTDCMGLVSLIHGRRVVELTAEAARVKGLRIYRRKPAHAVPLWELNDRPYE